jgi:hypothetical protein
LRILRTISGAVAVSVPVALSIATLRWNAHTANRLAKLSLRRSAAPRFPFEPSQLEGLPPPVARYLGRVLQEGQPIIRRASFRQSGVFLVRSNPDTWREFSAVETFTTDPPQFVWDAKIRMLPGLAVRVRDSFVEGSGSMEARFAAVWPLVSVGKTPEITAGALHRYLGEAAWLPTALLPGQSVDWTPIDQKSARATIRSGTTAVSLDFRFGEDGLLESVFTDSRMRYVEGHATPTPWRGRFMRYERRDGITIPTAAEVEWILPEGPQIYWKGEVTDVRFEFDRDAKASAKSPSLTSESPRGDSVTDARETRRRPGGSK